MNKPTTHKQVEELKVGESIISEFPNRRQRRVKLYPNSTKLVPSSMNNGNVRRKGKYRKD